MSATLVVEALLDGVAKGEITQAESLSLRASAYHAGGYRFVINADDPVADDVASLEPDGLGGIRVSDGCWQWTGYTTVVDEDQEFDPATGETVSHTYTIEGVGYLGLVGERLVLPNANTPDPANWTDGRYKIASSNAFDGLRIFMDNHAGPGVTNRDPVIDLFAGDFDSSQALPPGPINITGKAQNLLAIASARAEANAVALLGEADGRGTVTVTVRHSRRLPNIVFDQTKGAITRRRVTRRGHGVTALYTAGQGEGTARQWAYTDAGADGLRRIEGFSDRRSVDNQAELDELNLEDVALTSSPTSSITLELEDSSDYRLGLDYELGDFVTVVDRGQNIETRVSELEVSARWREGQPDTVTRRLTIGATEAAASIQARKALEARIAELEAGP